MDAEDPTAAARADEPAAGAEPEPRYQPSASPRTILIWVIVCAVVMGGSLLGLGYLVQ